MAVPLSKNYANSNASKQHSKKLGQQKRLKRDPAMVKSVQPAPRDG
jgi:hypothetical protein